MGLRPAFVLFSIANIVTWTWTGYNMITLFAALQNIPQELYEAARVDGATTWDIVRSIKLPLLMPTLAPVHFFRNRHFAALHRSVRVATAWLRSRQYHPQSLSLSNRGTRRELLVRRSHGYPPGLADFRP
jgi:ABC-type maltose transport system permease subunit